MSPVCVRARVGGEHYAFPVADVLEVADLGLVTPLPGASRVVLGVRPFHGEILPVLDLGAILGVPGIRDASRLVVAESGERRVGLAVDEFEDVGELPECAEQSDSRYLDGAALIDGALVGVVNVGAVIASAQSGERDDER